MINDDNIIKISRKELIGTFSDIDLKINNLHQRSSSDFMQLNNYLKDYHKKIRIILDNAFRIFETISGEKDIDLIKELGKINYRLDECIDNISEEDNRKIQNLKEIILKSNQLNIILRNIRQDFTTFKFLSTNYCLISNYKELDTEWNNKIDLWNAEIPSIQKSLVFLSNQVDVIKGQVATSIRYIESRVEKSLDIFQNLSKETKTNIGLVVLKSLESKLHFPILKEKSEDSSKSINDIITHLQYHDIIRQKIEHIQKSHYKIIDDLGRSIEENTSDDDYLPADYGKIGDIIDLQTAQLILVSKEYQNALNVITRNFLSMAKDMSAISGISDKFSFKDSNSPFTLLKQIKDLLDKGIILLDYHNFNEINDEFNEAGRNLELIVNKVKSNINPSLTKFTALYKVNTKSIPKDVSGSGVLSQIISLTRDIEIKHNDINERIIEISELYGNIFRPDMINTREYQLEMDRIQLMVNISKILDSLDKDNEELDKVLNQNRELNSYILEKIENAINQKDYYEYFETIVEQVIDKLKSVNGRIKPAFITELSENRAENLQSVKNAYTMESERRVHENVVSGSILSENAETQLSDNEIEFF